MNIKFNDLSGWLKTGIVLAYITGSIYALGIFIGFIQEVAR